MSGVDYLTHGPEPYHNSPVVIVIPDGEKEPVESVHRQIGEAMDKDEWLIPIAIHIHPEHWSRVKADPKIFHCANTLGGTVEFSGLQVVFDSKLPR